MTIDRLKAKLATKGKREPEGKTPSNWPFCICCHLAAPESKTVPLEWTNSLKGMAPNLEKWSKFVTPNQNAHMESHHLCDQCAAFVVIQIHRQHEAVKSKLTKIRESENRMGRCGLRIQSHINPFKSAFCSKPKGHLDACGP